MMTTRACLGDDGTTTARRAARDHHHTRPRSRRRALALVAGAAVAIGLLPFAGSSPAGAAAGDTGTEDHAYVEASNPTQSKPESKVWYQDGAWYAAMLKTGTPSDTGRPNADFYIYRLEGGTWVPTSTLIDNRGTTKVDVVSAGNTLYVTAHKFVANATGAVQVSDSNKTKINKFTYDSGSHTYTQAAGFPKVVNHFQMESLSVDVDSSGGLWVAWVQAGQVFWQHSTDGAATWSTPTALTDPNAVTSTDDVASVVAYGNHVGIMWSDQSPGHDGFWFATTAAGASPVTWAAAEAAYTGAGIGDDHLNLKALDGQVFAAVKTRTDTGTKPLVVVLRRSTGGVWSHQTAYIGSTNTTRPLLQLDATHQTAELFVTGPDALGGTGESGGAIYRKSAPLATLAFGAGLGERVMGRPGSGLLNDPSGTKQPVTSSTGLAVIAADSTTAHYWHHYETLVGAAPSAPSGVTVKAGAGKVVLTWTAATPGDAPIDHYRVTATPALPVAPADFSVSATGAAQQIAAPNDVSRVFHVQAIAGGDIGPAADSEPVTPRAYVPFTTTDAFANQQAKDFLGRSATAGEKTAVHSALVGGGKTAAQVVLGSQFYGNGAVASADGSGPEARVSRLYFAYFLRAPDKGGYDYWLRQLKSGQSLEAISRKFAASPEFNNRYGPLTNEGFVTLVYKNLFDRNPDSGGKTYWLNKLANGFPRGSMMTSFSESSEYRRRSARQVSTVIVYRHMLQKLPTKAQLDAEVAKASTDVTVADIIGSSSYQARIVP